jgi:hypothetical protein
MSISTMLKKLARIMRGNRLFWSFFGYSLFCWIWILEIDLGKLSSSTIVGTTLQLFTVLVLTLLSALLYTSSLRLFLVQSEKTKRWLVPIKAVMWWAATELFVAWAVSIIWYGVGCAI